ncbi:MAG: hypothetical protein J6T26_10630, partial [Firmicutes bacterium]|nr:hypothetical protein [Bacillota bacterium]
MEIKTQLKQDDPDPSADDLHDIAEKERHAVPDAREAALAGAALDQQERRYRKRLFLTLALTATVVFVICLLSGRYNCTKAELLASL